MDRLELASADGTRLVLHDLGGSGPAALIVHAAGFCARPYAPLARHLAGALHCYGLDLRAHGASDRPSSGDLAWSRYGEDVLAALDALGPDPILGIGHSLGGAALLLAALDRPGALRALYCYEPVALPAEVRARITTLPIAETARARRARFSSRAEALERFASRPPLDVLVPEALAEYVAHGFVELAPGGVTLACSPEDEARTYESARAAPLYEQLGEVDADLAVGCGELSEPLTARVAADIASRVRGARFERVAGLGHFGPLEDPERVAGAICRATEAARA